MKKKILLTGGTGYIGKNIILKLSNQYDFVNLGRNFAPVYKNILWNTNNEIDIDDEIDTVIHGASVIGNKGYNLREYVDVNVRFTSDILDFCTKNNVKNLIYLSTGGVYGFKNEKFKETDRCEPQGIYNLSKKFSEDLCLLKSSQMRIIIYRLFFPYGPNQKGRLFDNLIKNMIQKNVVNLNLGGFPKINPIYIDDLINIIKFDIESNNEGIYNVSGNEELSIENIARIINSYLNIYDLEYIYNNNKVQNLLGDNTKLSKNINLKNINNLENTIEIILDKYKL